MNYMIKYNLFDDKELRDLGFEYIEEYAVYKKADLLYNEMGDFWCLFGNIFYPETREQLETLIKLFPQSKRTK